MRVNFRQGLVSFQQDSGHPTFIQPSNTAGFLDHVVQPRSTIVTFAQGTSDYLQVFDTTKEKAWGPFVSNVTNYLYWDIDQLTSNVTYGSTILEPINSLSEPLTPQNGQHWFDLTNKIMKVWQNSTSTWLKKIRVFAGYVPNGNPASVVGYSIGTQVGLNVSVDAGYIILDSQLNPIKKSSGEFVTDTAAVHVRSTVGTSGVLVQPVNRLIQVRAGESIPRMSLVYFSNDDIVKLASSNPSFIPARIPVGLFIDSVGRGELGTLIPNGEVSYDQWNWSGHAGAPLYCGDQGEITLTRPPGLLAYRVGFVKNKNTVLISVDSETDPQVYSVDTTSLIITATSPTTVTNVVNGIGERVVTINVPLVSDTKPGLITPAQAASLSTAGENVQEILNQIETLSNQKADVSHTHIIGDITGLQLALDSKLSSTQNFDDRYAVVNHNHDALYAPIVHTHTLGDISGAQAALNAKANRFHLISFSEVFENVSRTTSVDAGSGSTLLQVLGTKSDVSHTHAIGSITGLTASLAGKANTTHTHVIADVTNLRTELDQKAFISHTQDMSSITGLVAALAAKSNTTHTHVIADVVGLQAALDAASQGGANKANVNHTHVIADVTGLQAALDARALVSHTHTISNVTGLQAALDAKAALVHSQDIATVNGLQSILDAKAPLTHTHSISSVTGLQAALDAKLSSSTTQPISNVVGLQAALDARALISHTQSIGSITDLQVTLDNKASIIHSQAISTITGLQSALDTKAASTHTHTASQIVDLNAYVLGSFVQGSGILFTTTNGKTTISSTGTGGTSGTAAKWLTGTSVPSSSTGINGDMYLNTVTSDIYGPKTSGAWGSVVANLKGKDGVDSSSSAWVPTKVTSTRAAVSSDLGRTLVVDTGVTSYTLAPGLPTAFRCVLVPPRTGDFSIKAGANVLINYDNADLKRLGANNLSIQIFQIDIDSYLVGGISDGSSQDDQNTRYSGSLTILNNVTTSLQNKSNSLGN